jgi:hypothetical protein
VLSQSYSVSVRASVSFDTEVLTSGEFRTGKSQICHTLAVTCQVSGAKRDSKAS